MNFWLRDRRLHFLLSALFLLTLIYWAALPLGSYYDDNPLIFTNAFIKSAQNPLRYWYRGQYDTKSWPLTHTIYWLCFRLFHFHYTPYRVFCLGLHWLNGVALFRLLSKRTRFSSAVFGTSLFLFHPAAVECVTWITQIGSLLTTLFFAFWLKNMEEDGAKPRNNFFALFGMLSTKSYAFFLPLLSTMKLRETVGTKKAILQSIPTFLITAYAVFLVAVGVYTYVGEKKPSVNYFTAPEATPAPSKMEEQKTAPKKEPVKNKKTKKRSTASIAEITTPKADLSKLVTLPHSSAWEFAAGQLYNNPTPNSWYEKIAACGRTSSYYVVRLLTYSELPSANLTFHPKWNPFFFCLGLLVFALLGLCIYKKAYVWAAGILVYLPVSALFYVPFMKMSLVSDRVVYLPLFAFAYGLGKLHDKLENPKLRRISWAWPVLLMFMAFFVVRQDRIVFPIF